MEDRPALTPLRPSLNRPQLLIGADRELVLLTGMLAALMAVTVMSFLSFVLAGLCFSAATAVLGRIAKADPLMRRVYARHVLYRDFYPAKSGVRVTGIKTRMGWR
jgi:type IV secretory pathway TrbD component